MGRMLAAVVAGALLVSACSDGGAGVAAKRSTEGTGEAGVDGGTPDGTTSDGSDSADPATGGSTPPVEHQTLVAPQPAPVAPVVLVGEDAAARAASAAAAFADRSTRTPALVAAIAASGVPVLGVDGSPIPGTGSDSIGMPWMHVATVAVANTTFSLPLSDVVQFYDQGLEQPRPAVGDLAQHTLDGLRAALSDPVPEVQFFAQLIAATSRRLGGGDVADPAVTPDLVLLDAPTIEVYVSRVWRSLALNLAASGDLVDEAGVAASGWAPVAPAAPGIDCSSDGMDGWGLWILSKVTGGVDLSALGLGTFDGILLETMNRAHSAKEVSDVVVKGSKKLMKFANYFASSMTAINLAYELMSFSATATMSPSPLVRNKKRSEGDGGKAIITVVVSMTPPTDSDFIQAVNCLAALASGIGNNSTLPPPGPVSGVNVQIRGAKGFSTSLVEAGTKVLFGPTEVNLNPVSDANGAVTIPVQGRRQSKDHPDTATATDERFSISVAAHPEQSGASSAGKAFLDDLLCVVAPGIGCADAVADVVKSFHWDLGTFEFPLVDWMESSYRIVGGLEDWQVDQVVCNVMAPFTLSTDVGTMQLSGGLTGTYSFSGVFASSYTGEYRIDFPNGADQPGTMIGGGAGTIADQAGSGTETYTVTPVDPC